MSEAITPGAVVRLKSGGGPNMTVESREEAVAWCVWFDKNGVLQKSTFKVAALEVSKPGSEMAAFVA